MKKLPTTFGGPWVWWTISDQLRKVTTAPRAYGPGDYGYLCNGELNFH